MQIIYELVPVIADIISAHCSGTNARKEFVRACVHGHWDEAAEMTEGMLAEPWHLKGYQEARLREFRRLLQMDRGTVGQLMASHQHDHGM
jgi:hypothetical protein